MFEDLGGGSKEAACIVFNVLDGVQVYKSIVCLTMDPKLMGKLHVDLGAIVSIDFLFI